MRITFRPMTVEESWKYIVERHKDYHRKLKKFGYTYKTWVPKPNNEYIKSMFEKETLSELEFAQYKKFFVNNIYNAEDLKKYDEYLKSFVIPMMERGVNKFLVPLLTSWGATLPDELTILCTYGSGASYSEIKDGKATITFRMSRYPDNKQVMLETMLHEFIHLVIERPIIKKYKVPQDLKERIVDIIGYELFDKISIQERFANSFANAYITPETIKSDLPGAVAKMMADYTAVQQKQEQAKFLEQYEPLKNARVTIQGQIDELVAKDAVANLAQINELVDKRDAYRAGIIKLLNKGTEKSFDEYAKKLFDMSIYVIGKNLSGSAVKFDKLSINEKLSFAQEFINHIASRFHVVPNKLVYKTDLPAGMGAEYDDKTDNININKDDMNNLQYVVGMILHEFTHYLYYKYPEKTPIGKERAIVAVAESHSGYRNLDEYKQKPFEAVAYYVQDFFEKHKFSEQLFTLVPHTPER